MADLQKYAQIQPTTLAGAGVSLGDNSMTLSSFQDIDGNLLTMVDFGTSGFGTVEPGALTQEEQIRFTGITQNVDGTATLTGISNVGFLSPYTQTANFAKSHAGGVKFIISNTSGFYNTFANKNDDETIVGSWIFTEATRPALTVDLDATVDTQLITHGELARTAILGSVAATTATPGIALVATGSDISTPTDTRNYLGNPYSIFVLPSQLSGAIAAISVNVQTFTGNGVWTKPVGAKTVEVVVLGAGGGGGSGGTTNNHTGSGGAGGGGGAVSLGQFNASSLGANETVTIGSGGSGGAGQVTGGTDGNDGTDGVGSSFGTWLFAGGGGKGLHGRTGAAGLQGGGGGGSIGTASGATGGTPAVAGNGIGGQGPTAPAATVAGRSAEFGGGTGAGGNSGGGATLTGGSSIFGSGGGGAGADDNNAAFAGGDGGTVQSYTSGGGGAGGVNTGGNGTAGASNATLKRGYGGSGGGGGGITALATTAGAGGGGGVGAGGGGGAASANGTTSGAGGNGGRGEVRVYTYF